MTSAHFLLDCEYTRCRGGDHRPSTLRTAVSIERLSYHLIKHSQSALKHVATNHGECALGCILLSIPRIVHMVHLSKSSSERS